MNVIVVDWQKGAAFPYTQATANTRVVGAQIAQIANQLMNTTGATPDSFHVIGHSLGAHVAGYAGERIKNLGRISGGPYEHTCIQIPYLSRYQSVPSEIAQDTRWTCQNMHVKEGLAQIQYVPKPIYEHN